MAGVSPVIFVIPVWFFTPHKNTYYSDPVNENKRIKTAPPESRALS